MMLLLQTSMSVSATLASMVAHVLTASMGGNVNVYPLTQGNSANMVTGFLLYLVADSE